MKDEFRRKRYEWKEDEKTGGYQALFRTNRAVDNKQVEDDIMNLQSSTNERGVIEKCCHILRTLVPHLILEKHTGGPGIIGEDRIKFLSGFTIDHSAYSTFVANHDNIHHFRFLSHVRGSVFEFDTVAPATLSKDEEIVENDRAEQCF